MTNPELTLTIVMPALNEQDNIALAIQNALDAIDEIGIDAEVVVVNDGSNDRTPDIIAEFMARDSRIQVIHHGTPHGIGASFWEGVDASHHGIVIMLPGDNENDPWEILQYFDLLKHVDIVIPFVFNRQARGVFRTMLSFLYRFIINTSFFVNLNYTNGTVLYRKSILKEIKHRSSGFFFQTDILIRSIKKGYLFAEVPYRLGVRNTGKSKAVSYPSLVNVIRGYLRLVFDFYFRKKGALEVGFVSGSSTSRRHTEENDMYKVNEPTKSD